MEINPSNSIKYWDSIVKAAEEKKLEKFKTNHFSSFFASIPDTSIKATYCLAIFNELGELKNKNGVVENSILAPYEYAIVGGQPFKPLTHLIRKLKDGEMAIMSASNGDLGSKITKELGVTGQTVTFCVYIAETDEISLSVFRKQGKFIFSGVFKYTIGKTTIGNLRSKALDDTLKALAVGETARFDLQVLQGENIDPQDLEWRF